MRFRDQQINKNYIAIILTFWLISGCVNGSYKPRTGDIVFQDLEGPSSEYIRIATDSPYSHCGIVTVENEKAYIIEAVGPVRKITLERWIAQGRGRFTAMRPDGKINANKIIEVAESFMGFPYDRYYEWDDQKLYCSELVYKAYLRGDNIRLCSPKRFGDYNIDVVRRSIIERYGDIPESMEVVAPADLANSSLLKTVFSNFPDKK